MLAGERTRMDVDIAKRLADRRRAAGLTQEELAEKLGGDIEAAIRQLARERKTNTES